jgi:maltokinase
VTRDALLDRLRAAWPPADAPAGDYRTGSLRGTRPLAAMPLGDGAVVVAEGSGGALAAAPLASAGDGTWRVAVAGDGLAAELVARLASPAPVELESGWTIRPAGATGSVGREERPMGVDQTNVSVVVGERLVVKWYRQPDPAGERAPGLLRHLAAVGFGSVPPLAGSLEWSDAGAAPVTVALVDGFLPGVRDGWDWTIDAVLAHVAPGHRCDDACPARFAGWLGRLAAELHVALATPSAVLPAPVGRADAATIRGWAAAARATLAEAVTRSAADDPAAGRALAAWTPALEARLAGLDPVDATAIQPIHGDLHVGQLPRWRDGVAVIDFDGNPALPAAARAAPQPAARDVAQLQCSVDHVGRAAARRLAAAGGRDAGARIDAWIEGARDALLATYRTTLAAAGRSELLDERLLPAFVVEQESWELVYAARFLPRWRYAPLAAIRAIVAR